MITSFQAFEIKDFEQCEPVPAELTAQTTPPVFDGAKKNIDLLYRYQKTAEYAALERSLRLQLIGAIKQRELSSGRKKEEYAAIAEDIRLQIEELNRIEASRGRGFLSRLNPFD